MIKINAMAEWPCMFRNVWPISTRFYIPNMFFLAGFKTTAGLLTIVTFFHTFTLFFLLILSRLFCIYITNLHSMFLSVEGCRSTAESLCSFFKTFSQRTFLSSFNVSPWLRFNFYLLSIYYNDPMTNAIFPPKLSLYGLVLFQKKKRREYRNRSPKQEF